ncbi:MAG TPA: inositol monophosphatase family protein [Bacteroidota bacterium]
MLELGIKAALEAGELIRKHAGNAKNVERKLGQETNLVTELDRQAEEIIIRHIRREYPDHDVLAEESGDDDRRSEYRWIIDPIDGTTNFAHGLPIYSVSIGLEHNGDLVAGVVYDPSREELFTAEKGKGASLNRERIRVSGISTLIESVLVTGFPYDVKSDTGNIRHFQNFLVEAQAVRRLGSAALDLCYVACGRLDGYWEMSLSPWDMAAGVLLVQEAGGTVTDHEGKASTVHKRSVLATNGLIHEQMIRILAKGNPR